jgi:ketosteroid isomerase-like protein
MKRSTHELVTGAFAATEAKDLDLLMSLFDDNATLIDPHFPNPRMEGKPAIAEGLRGAFAGMHSFGYTIVNYFETENGRSAAAEIATHHTIKRGWKLNFPQVFVFDARDGRITRMQAYEPYGPNGIMGVFMAFARLKKRYLGR